MPLDPESLYRQIGRLIETMPDFSDYKTLTKDMHLWLGRADALVNEGGELTDKIDWRVAVTGLHGPARADALGPLQQVLYRVMAAAELKAPASAKGTFIPVGNSFDAFASLAKILRTAIKDVLIVDPYMDETALTDFGSAVPEGVSLRLLADETFVKGTLQPAATKWIAQYGTTRPLQIRLAPTKTLHDRAIFIDHATAWTLTQSLKDFAKRSPAEIVRADDTAVLKVIAYETIWKSSRVLV